MNEDKSDVATADMPADTGTTAVRDSAGCKKMRSTIAALILCAAAVTSGWYLCHEIHEVRDALFLMSLDFSKFTKGNLKTSNKDGTEKQSMVLPNSTADKDILNKLRSLEDKIDKLKVAIAPKNDVVQTPLNMGDVRDAISEAERLESSGDHLKAGATLSFATYTTATTTVSVLAGPVGWSIAGANLVGGAILASWPDSQKTANFVITAHLIKTRWVAIDENS
jgi:hypothetical protein